MEEGSVGQFKTCIEHIFISERSSLYENDHSLGNGHWPMAILEVGQDTRSLGALWALTNSWRPTWRSGHVTLVLALA